MAQSKREKPVGTDAFSGFASDKPVHMLDLSCT